MRIPRLQLALSVVLAGSLVGIGLLLRQCFFPSTARLIQEAYSEQRTVELRLGKAPHSALRVQRGGGTTPMERSASLLESEAAIARGLRNHPEDPALLAARGQVNLLEWSYEAAITDMQEALDLQPKSAAVLNGLAAAYFERAEAEDRFEDYGTAFELQSRALQQSPNDSVLLFNRAITGSRLFLYKQSIEDFERYLGIDSSSEWADEARQRLNEVNGIVEAHDQRTKAPLLTPAEFVQQVVPTRPETWEKVEPRIEEYLSAAITDWLPAAWPEGRVGPERVANKRALEVLALILQERHNDTWLSELLSKTDSASFAEAATVLRDAVKADNSDYMLGKKEAGRAARLFALAGNVAGELRARFEEIYATRLSDAASECLEKLGTYTSSVEHSGYKRLLIQTQLEKYNCSTELGDFNRVDQLTQALRDSHSAVYESAEIRLLSTLAVDELFKGKRLAGLNRCQSGLREYWGGSSIEYLGRTLYSAASYSYEGQQKWHLARAARDQLLSIASSTKDPLSLAIEHTNLAHVSLLAAEPVEAGVELEKAQKLLSSVTQTEVTANYRTTEEIYAALVDADSGKPDDGLLRLEHLRPQILKIANINVVADFHRVAGELQALIGHLLPAEEELTKSVALGERVRAAMRSESERISWTRAWSRPYLDLVEVELRKGSTLQALAIWELYCDFRIDRTSLAIGSSLSPELDMKSMVASTIQLIDTESESWNDTFSRWTDGTVLILANTPHGLAAWTYDDRGLSVRWLPRDLGEMTLEIQRLAELCGQPRSSQEAIKSSARSVYKSLIGPIAENLRQNQILAIQTDDVLSLVPFQALIDTSGRYLGDEHPVSHLSSLSFAGDAPSDDQAITSRSRALIVANPGTPGSGLRQLPDVLAEAQSVLSYFPQGELLAADQASIPTVTSKLGAAQVFHFAGHASMQSDGNALLLRNEEGGDAPFSSSKLNSIPMHALRLVVLSACSTENGKEGSLEDFNSLVRVFLTKGVPHVLATRWNVDSSSTVSLMRLFYQQLLAGSSVPRSLAIAEAAFRQTAPHPYYWAAFDAFGKN